jgi:thiaminase/transcriptional activator TenA
VLGAFWEHPALAGLREGSLPSECVRHYLGQDYHYLTGLMRCRGLRVALSPNRDWVGWFRGNVRFLVAGETHPHRAPCRAIGVRCEDVQQRRLAPTARHYIDHIPAARRDSLGVAARGVAAVPVGGLDSRGLAGPRRGR